MNLFFPSLKTNEKACVKFANARSARLVVLLASIQSKPRINTIQQDSEIADASVTVIGLVLEVSVYRLVRQ